MTDPTYEAIEHDDESERDELARTIFQSHSTHIARSAAARQFAKNDASHTDLMERVERLETAHELEETAKYVIWEITTAEKRSAYLTEYRRRHGKDQFDDLMRICKRLAARHFVQLSEQEGL